VLQSRMRSSLSNSPKYVRCNNVCYQRDRSVNNLLVVAFEAGIMLDFTSHISMGS